MEELAQLIIVGLVALWLGYKMRKNNFEEEIKSLNTDLIGKNDTVLTFLTEVNAEIADSRLERGGLMVKLDKVVQTIENYEKTISTREGKEKKKNKNQKPQVQEEEQKNNEIT